MAEDDDDEGPDEGTIRRPCTMPMQTYRYLEKLAKKGTHGSRKVSGVMTFLITQGIQDAIGKGIIKAEDSD
jgi:hypothetical protein